MKPKLSFDEFQKAIKAGVVFGGACACLGPQSNDEYCPCSMDILDKIIESDHSKIIDLWRSNGYYPASELKMKEEERGISQYRKKRLELIAAKFQKLSG